MALFNKVKSVKTDNTTIADVGSELEHGDDYVEMHDDTGTEENDDHLEGGGPPPKRRIRGSSPYTETDESDAEDPPVTPIIEAPAKSEAQQKPPSAKRDRVSLSADINRDMHARLKIHSFRTHKSLGTLLEDMISLYCPE